MVKRRRTTKRSVGRAAGSHNRGYWFRKGRGWYITEGRKLRPLTDQSGNHIKAQNAPSSVLQDAYKQDCRQSDERSKQSAKGSDALILTAVTAYLKHSQANDRLATFNKRGKMLFDRLEGARRPLGSAQGARMGGRNGDAPAP